VQRCVAFGLSGDLVEEAGADQSDAIGFRPIDQPFSDAVSRQFVSGFRQGGHWIDDQTAGFMRLRKRLDAHQTHLCAAGIPTEAKLRTTSVPSESKLTNMVRSPRRQAASANALLKVVFAVPGKPVISTQAAR
jgi:hypothetical protein